MKLLLILLLLCVLVAVLAELEEDRAPKRGGHKNHGGHGHRKRSRRERFGDFRKRHRKRYRSPEEEEKRMYRYNMTLNRIERHNEEAAKGRYTYTMAENHLSDMYPEEVQVMTGAIAPPMYSRFAEPSLEMDLRQPTPVSMDLREDSCMPPIKNQGRCGSCWAFAAITPLEYQHCKSTGSVALLSEQQLVSCSGQACRGGFYLTAYNYIKRAGGIESAVEYPYDGTTSNCTFEPENTVVRIASSGWVYPLKNEIAIEKAVARNGPTPVCIHVNANFMSYDSGIFNDPDCRTDVNHAVVAVGYGTNETLGGDYWIIRNTWGPEWGEDGYVLIKRGVNMCGISGYPVWVKIQ